MDGGDERQPQGEEAKVNGAPAGGSMVTTDFTLGANFLQRQLKDLLLPDQQRDSGEMPSPEPGAALPARQTSPSLLASFWPVKAGGEPHAPPSHCAPAERPLNGTHGASVQPMQPLHDAGVLPAAPLVAAAAALAEPSPAVQEGLGQAVPGATAPEADSQPLPPQPGGAAMVQLAQPAVQQQQQQAPVEELPRPPPRPEPPDPQQPVQQQLQPAQPATQQLQQQAAPRLSEREAEGMAALEAILARIRGLDTEGWFWAPVRDVDAPNYSRIIKQPMCFQVMLGKIQARQYVNWNEVVRDFELICSNAMKYNQKRSRIHKLALIMLRAGKKLLVEVEQEGRRAIAELQSGQQQQEWGLPAAPAEPQDSQALPSSLLRSDVAGATSTLPPSSAPGTGAAHLARSLSTMDTATTSETSRDALGVLDLDLGTLGPSGEEPEGGYSSYSDTDLDEGEAQAPALEQLLQEGGSVLVEVYGWAGGEGQQQEQDGPGTAAEAKLPADKQQAGQPRAWKASRRSVEWRIRWLELRLRELRRQRQRYAARQSQASQQQQRQHQPRQRLPPAELRLPGLLSHPFFAAAVGRSAPLQQQQPDTQPAATAAAAAPEVSAAPGVALDDPNYAARAHVTLDLLERRLGALRQEVLSLQRPEAGAGALLGMPGARAGGHHALLLPRGGSGGRARSRAPATPRSRSGLWAPAKPSSHRDDVLGKRRRADYDIGDIITNVGAPKYVERAQVKTIDTPKVRLVAAAELKRREAALAAYAANLREGLPEERAAEPLLAACTEGESGGGGGGGAVGEQAPGRGGGVEEGESSEEDISDEAYAARHKALEEEERTRYQSFAGKPSGQRNKKPTKLTDERGRMVKPSRAGFASPYHTPVPTTALGLTPTASLGGHPASTPLALALAPVPSSAPAALALPPSAAAAVLRGGAPSGAQPALAEPAAAAQQGQAGGAGAPGGAVPLLVMPMHAAVAAAHMQVAMAAAAAAAAAAGATAPEGASPAPPREGLSGALAEGGASPAPAPGTAPTQASATAVPPLPPAAGAAQQQQPAEPGAASADVGVGGAASAALPHSEPSATLPVPHSQLPPALQAIIPHGPPDPSQMQPPPPREGRASGRPRGRPRLRPRG